MAVEHLERKLCHSCAMPRNYAALVACILVMPGFAGCRTSAADGETLSRATAVSTRPLPSEEHKTDSKPEATGFEKPGEAALNPGLVEIKADEVTKYRQVAAVSDVHGHYLNALHLLQKAQIVDSSGKWSGDKTLLVVIGDSIDKGPSSIPMLRCWLDLQAQAGKVGGRVLVLLGNHEAELLAGANGKSVSPDLRRELDAEGMTAEQLTGDAPDPKGYKLGIFLRQMPLGAKIGSWLFCHAGWPPDPQSLTTTKSTPQILWTAWQEQARKQDYAALTQEASEGKAGPEYGVLEKKFVGEGGSQELQGEGAAKWWESEQEVGRLLTRLDQYGFTGVVFGHQPAAFGLKDAVGPYTDPDKHVANYRLLKIDSGMATASYDGLQDGKQPRNAGHMLLFKNVAVLTQSLENYKPDAPLPGLQTIANVDDAAK